MRVAGPPAAVSPRYWSLLLEEALAGQQVLDLGCGAGRLALALAPLAGGVVGLDRDAALVQEARRRARDAGLGNARFHVADVEQEEYGRWAPDLVTAHLCCSAAIVERAGRALGRGRCLALVALHVDQWRETGRVSRFAWDEARMAEALGAHGFAAEVIEVDREVRRFGSVQEGLVAAAGLEARWRGDGRWQDYLEFLEAGGRTLTRSHLVVKARRA